MEPSIFDEQANEILKQTADMLREADEEGVLEIDLTEDELTIVLADGEEYILSKQDDSMEIILSSPFSGTTPFSYDEEDDVWQNAKGEMLEEMLGEELEHADIIIEF